LSTAERDRSWLAALVAPVPAREFVDSYWTARPLFCRGSRQRFADLLDWDQLNDILEHHWREVFRFRLAFKGRDIDPAEYADLDGYTPRVRAKDITDYLRSGATLSFDAIDELHPPLTRLAEAFDDCFGGATKINIYAGWRALHGLDLHRDNQEIFILQLDGPKRWLLYGFSIEGIDAGALREQSIPPAGAALDQVLEAGDLLYVPRGCYHLAVPMDVPTLHLTIGVKLPAVGKPRPSFSLPYSATLAGLPTGSEFVVRLNGPTPVIVAGSEGDTAVAWQCGARTYHFPKAMRPILTALKVSQAIPFATLAATVGAETEEALLRFLLAMLVKLNLVSIRRKG